MNVPDRFQLVCGLFLKYIRARLGNIYLAWKKSSKFRRLCGVSGGYITASVILGVLRVSLWKYGNHAAKLASYETTVPLTTQLNTLKIKKIYNCGISGDNFNFSAHQNDERSSVTITPCGKTLISRHQETDISLGTVAIHMISSALVPGSLQKVTETLMHLHEIGFIKSFGVEPDKTLTMKAIRNVVGPIFALGFWYIVVNSMMRQKDEDPQPRLLSDKRDTIPKTRFSDVILNDHILVDMKEIVQFIKEPDVFLDRGIRRIRGVLLYGPSGTGKTLLARALSGEAGIPFFAISGAELVDTYVGRGASRVKKIFETARSCAPSIVFIDEIDAIGDRQSAHEEYVQTINQLLTELDGVTGSVDGVIVVAATNRISSVDVSLRRPGRFDRHIQIDMPNESSRERILEVHASRLSLMEGTDISIIASDEFTKSFTGADLENLINEAAYMAMRREKNGDNAEVNQNDLVAASKKCQLIVSERKIQNRRSPAEMFRAAFQ